MLLNAVPSNLRDDKLVIQSEDNNSLNISTNVTSCFYVDNLSTLYLIIIIYVSDEIATY